MIVQLFFCKKALIIKINRLFSLKKKKYDYRKTNFY
jgi:hypothetical protein